MSDIRQAQEALVKRILEGSGNASPSDRRDAFNDSGLPGPISKLADKIARNANRITDDDITTTKAAGLSEDQLFEIAVCAAIGQATRQYDAALAALEVATGKK